MIYALCSMMHLCHCGIVAQVFVLCSLYAPRGAPSTLLRASFGLRFWWSPQRASFGICLLGPGLFLASIGGLGLPLGRVWARLIWARLFAASARLFAASGLASFGRLGLDGPRRRRHSFILASSNQGQGARRRWARTKMASPGYPRSPPADRTPVPPRELRARHDSA